MTNKTDKPYTKHRLLFDKMTADARDANAGFYSVTYHLGEGNEPFWNGLQKLMSRHKVTGVMAVMPDAASKR